MKPSCLFSYYGSKSKVIRHYPAPKHDLIIEPFAGGGCYSLQHADRQVWLNELNPVVYGLWDYLIHADPSEVISKIPKSVTKGQCVSDLLPPDAPEGLKTLLRANCNMGTLGTKGTHEVVTYFAAVNWHQVHPRLERFLPKIRHWRLTNIPAVEIPNQDATWFIDPPYSGDAGKRYRFSNINFQELGDWCQSRNGQVIVCENSGATWLPFIDLVPGMVRGGVRRQVEAIWEKA